jgi:hypothetical protein
MNKRGVSEVITTVLIILLVLAAIVIVWQAVRGTVENASTKVETQSQCIGLDLSVTGSCTGSTLSVQVTRGGDSVGAGQLRVSIASGTFTNSTTKTNFAALDSASFDKTSFGLTTITSPVTINTGLIVTGGPTCQGTTKTITCTA